MSLYDRDNPQHQEYASRARQMMPSREDLVRLSTKALGNKVEAQRRVDLYRKIDEDLARRDKAFLAALGTAGDE